MANDDTTQDLNIKHEWNDAAYHEYWAQVQREEFIRGMRDEQERRERMLRFLFWYAVVLCVSVTFTLLVVW